jgi:hypothetical protein
MRLERLEKHVNLSSLKEEFRKIGGNFINHYVGSKLSTMFWSAFWVTLIGIAFLTIGLIRVGGK